MSFRAVVTTTLAGALAAGFVSPVVAQSSKHASDFGIGVNFGTMGIGVDLSKLVTSHIGLRAGGNFFNLTLNDKQQTDVSYDAKLKIGAFSGLVDLYPGARGSFHFTGGVVTNPAKITATGVATGGNYTFNDHDYTAAQVGDLTGTGKFGSVLPYVGIGFGTAASKHGGLSRDLRSRHRHRQAVDRPDGHEPGEQRPVAERPRRPDRLDPVRSQQGAGLSGAGARPDVPVLIGPEATTGRIRADPDARLPAGRWPSRATTAFRAGP